MKRFVILIVAVLAVSVIWMAGWFYIAGQIRAEITALAQADGITQPRLTCEALDIGGAPFSFSPHCGNAEIVSADTTITLPAISGTALFYRPFHIQAFATGPARISDAFTGSAQEVDWSNLHASLRLSDGAIERLSAVADDLTYADVLMDSTELASAAHGEVHLIESTGPDRQPGTGMIYDFYLTFEGAQSRPLEFTNGTIILDGQLTGVPDPALWGDPDLIAFWQAYGGQLTLRNGEAVAEGLSLNVEGHAALDDLGRVNGELEVTSQKVSERIADLVGDPSVAQIILGSPDDSGVSRQTLRVEEGTVTVGIIPVTTLPPLF